MRIPQVPGRYEIRSLLGAGGMGEVYLADDLNLHRRVAIKLCLPTAAPTKIDCNASNVRPLPLRV